LEVAETHTGTIQITLLAASDLVEGNVVIAAAVWDGKPAATVGNFPKPVLTYNQLALPAGH
jgi:hypothetical protein